MTTITVDIYAQHLLDFVDSPGNEIIITTFDFADIGLRGNVMTAGYTGTIGPVANHASNIFTDPADMANYYFSTASAALISAINSAQSLVTYVAGNLLMLDETTQQIINSKQDQHINLTKLSASTLTPNALFRVSSDASAIDPLSMSDFAASLMSAVDSAALAGMLSLPYSSLTGIPTIPTAVSQLTNDSSFISSSAASSTFVAKTVTVNSKPLSSNITLTASDLSLATVASTGAYSDLTGKPSLFSGSYLDLTNKPSLFSGAYTDLTGKPTLLSQFINDSGFVTSSSLTSTLSGYATTSALTSGLAGKQATLSTGTISQYLKGDLSLGTFASDVRNAISVTGNGSYNSSTGVVTINTPNTVVFNNPTRSLNTAFQASTTQNAIVTYSVDVTCAMSLTSGQSGTVVLEYADDSGFTTNVKTACKPTNANSGALTIGLALTQINGVVLHGVIPANKYVRLRTVNNTGTPTYTLQNAQEVLI